MSTIDDKRMRSCLNDISNSLKGTRTDMIKGFDTLNSTLRDQVNKIGESVKGDNNPFGGKDNGIKEGIIDAISKAYTGLQLSKLVSSMDKASKSLIDSTNSIQQLGVGTYEEVKEFRNFVKTTQKELNGITGGSYNLKKMYADIATLAKETDIARLDTLKEVTKPAMLAYKAMNVSLSSIADVSSKLYEFASFDSLKLEGLFDHVKTISTGMNVNEQTIIDSMNTLSSTITARAYKDGYQVDNEEIYKGISNLVATLEDSGIDSKEIVQLLDSYMEGDIEARKTMLKLTGRDDWAEDFLVGNTSNFANALMTVGSDWFESFSSGLENASSDALGVNYDLLESIYNAKKSGRWDQSLNSLNDNILNPTTMGETVNDQQKDWKDKILNRVSSIEDLLADSRELFGVSLAQLVSLGVMIYTAIRTIRSFSGGGTDANSILGNIGSNLSKSKVGQTTTNVLKTAGNGVANVGSTLLGNVGTATSGASSKLGLSVAGKAATGAGLAGVAAGGALAIDGIKGLTDKDADGVSKGLSAAELGAGVAGAGLLLASNPVGWAVLAAGGVAFLGKKIYEDATELSGNAKAAIESMGKIEESLEKENATRLKNLADLKGAYKDAESLEEKRNLLASAGLASMDDLVSMNEDGLNSLLDAYTKSADEMNSITKSLIKFREKEVSNEQNKQQKEFLNEMHKQIKNGTLDKNSAYNAYSQLMAGVTDEDVLAKWDKFSKDGKISKRESRKLKKALKDVGVDVSAMQTVDNLYDVLDEDLIVLDEDKEHAMAKIMNDLLSRYGAYNSEDTDAKDVIKNQLISYIDNNIRTSEYLEDLKSSNYYKGQLDEIAKGLGIEAFRKGTDYVESDQLALVHEGEAIIPKKDNPIANIAELESLRRQLVSANANNNSNDKLTNTVNDLVGVVKTILTVFNEYVEEVDKRYNDDKLDSTIKHNKLTTNKSLLDFLM